MTKVKRRVSKKQNKVKRRVSKKQNKVKRRVSKKQNKVKRRVSRKQIKIKFKTKSNNNKRKSRVQPGNFFVSDNHGNCSSSVVPMRHSWVWYPIGPNSGMRCKHCGGKQIDEPDPFFD